MHAKARQYLFVESAASGVVNGILNCAAGFLLFHGRGRIPVDGPVGLVRDSIGETFLVASLSYLAAVFISRHRRRAGTLPETSLRNAPYPGNPYVWSFAVGLLFTCLLVPVNAWLLPQAFPNGVTLGNVVLFKTLFGAVLGSIATGLAISKALNEAHPLPNGLTG